MRRRMRPLRGATGSSVRSKAERTNAAVSLIGRNTKDVQNRKEVAICKNLTKVPVT